MASVLNRVRIVKGLSTKRNQSRREERGMESSLELQRQTKRCLPKKKGRERQEGEGFCFWEKRAGESSAGIGEERQEGKKILILGKKSWGGLELGE